MEKPLKPGKPVRLSFAKDLPVRPVACLDRETVVGVLTGALTLEDVVSDHVDSCAACLDLIQDVSETTALGEYQIVARNLADPGRNLGPPLAAGDLGSVDGLAIESVIGRGGMGVVYRARDNRLKRTVAVKLLRRGASAESDTRFEREAQAAANLCHPNIVPVFQAGRTDQGQPFLVMPLISGKSLRDRLQGQPMAAPEAALIVEHIALGLDAAHKAGMIHRDVKPANILLDQEDGTAKLTDFGLVRRESDETLTQGQVICGTPLYMSPEQIGNPTSGDPRGDIYSLGVVLYECLTGTTPFHGMPMEILDQHRSVDPAPPRRLVASVPLDLQNVCLKAMAKRQDDRYSTSREFAADMRRFLEGRPVLAREISSSKKLLIWCRRNRAMAALVAVSASLLLVLAAGSSFAAWKSNKSNRTISEQRNRAERAELAAITDRTTAVESLERLVDSLYDDLSANAATIQTREKIVAAAMAGLETLANSSADGQADQTLFRAQVRMGDLSSLQRNNDEAEKHYRQAVEVAVARFDSQPDSKRTAQDEALKDKSLALSKLARHYFQVGDDRCEQVSERAREVLLSLVARNNNDGWARIQLLSLDAQQLGWIRRSNPTQPQRVIEFGQNVLDDLAEVRAIVDNRLELAEVTQNIHFRIGRAWLESSAPEKADEQFQVAEVELELLLADSSGSFEFRSAAAALYRARGMAAGAMGRLDLATSSLENAVREFELLTRIDSDNRSLAIEAANTQTILGMARQFAGEIDEAIRLRLDSVDTFTQLLERTPSDHAVRNLRFDGRFALTDLWMEAGEWTLSHRMLEELKDDLEIASFASSMHAQSAGLQAKYDTNREIVDHLLDNKVEQGTAQGKEMACFWLLQDFARTGKSTALPNSIGEHLKRIHPTFSGTTVADAFAFLDSGKEVWNQRKAVSLIFQARIYGMIAKNVALSKRAGNEGMDVSKGTNRELEASLSAIRELAVLMPDRIRDVIFNMPDLIWLRKQPAFEKAWQEILARE